MNPGTYLGKITDCSLELVGENKTPVIEIYFLVSGNDESQNVRLNLWLSKKQEEKTGLPHYHRVIDQLLKLGYKGDGLERLADPTVDISELFDTHKEYNVVVDYQKDQSGAATQYLEVRWVNLPRRSTEALTQAKAMVQQNNEFRAAFLAAKQRYGGARQSAPPVGHSVDKKFDHNDIPF